MRDAIKSNNAPAAIGPYSQAIRHGNMVFTSGQIPLDPSSGAIVGSDIRTQTEQVLNNLQAVLEAAGAGFDQVVKTTCFLNDMNDFAPFNEVYQRFFTGTPPARSCVAVERLPKDVLVEIEAVAII
ncbi:MAG: RidA family protein [Desulfofustis sp.]|jgi:2-iminobutanoate/2-iminopropanoate deaminase|nr:RidA family protein [Desulfofustis sp.]